MSAKPQQAWTALIDTLEAAIEPGETLEYVKGVFEGVREGITSFPVLIVEPLSEPETVAGFTGQTDVKLMVSVVGIIKVMSKEKQIVGSGDTKGIMDLKNDLAKVLSVDPTLGSVVTDTIINSVEYDWRDYPHRAFTMDIEIQYRQTTKTRV